MARMFTAQNAYFGPNPDIYPLSGSVFKNETVTPLWHENGWVLIEYLVTGDSNKKRGYVPLSSIDWIDGRDYLNLKASVITSCDTYSGPSSAQYSKSGSLSAGETVTILLKAENSYAYIEYGLSGSSQKKRAYVANSKLSTDDQDDFDDLVGTVLADFKNDTCYGSGNMYTAAGFKGECTWYAWGRTRETTGKRLVFKGPNNGGQWYSNINAEASGVTRRSASLGPITRSLVSLSGSTNAGHVAFIEKVDGDTVYLTEANVGGTDGVLKKKAKTTFMGSRTVYGYIVL